MVMTLGYHTYRHDENLICIDILFAIVKALSDQESPTICFMGSEITQMNRL